MAKKYKIIHIFNDPKFSVGFFNFLIEHEVNLNNHFLFHYRCTRKNYNAHGMQAIFSKSFFSMLPNLFLIKPLFNSEKIIIHSLASPALLFYLYLFPRLAHKSYWVIWGKDLYFYKILKKKYFYHEIYEFYRRKVIKNIGHVITFSEGDYELSKKWYKTDNAVWHKSFMYPSNLYKEIKTINKASSKLVILVGNSGDPSNNHLDAFSIINKYSKQNIEIIAPLSYGDPVYSQKVIKHGKELFGDKFIPLTQLLPLPEYLNLLNRVNIAVFAHERQQATGNIITLLGMKKKVFLRKDVTTWKHLRGFNLEIFDIYDFNINELSNELKMKNHTIIKNIFSEENLIRQWKEIEFSSV